MIEGSILLLFSAAISLIAVFIVFSIFRKVYQEDYKRPWLFIGISTLFLICSQLLRFFYDFFNFQIINLNITEYAIYLFDFISITILAYALLLEMLILKYYKGKFVKMKFIPVQEGSLSGDLDLDISPKNSYIAIKKDRNFLFEQFTQATKKGFEGFLFCESNPREIRLKYGIIKTPIAWITQIEKDSNEDYKRFIDSNSDVIDPLQLNNMVHFIDNFLEQSQSPFIMLELNLLFRTNNKEIVNEFLTYITAKIEKYNGIFIGLLNLDVLQDHEIAEIKTFLKELE